jgi:lathosterol oxidase
MNKIYYACGQIFVAAFCFHAVRYFLAAGLAFFTIGGVLGPVLRLRKIQHQSGPWLQISREIGNSLSTMFVFALIGVGMFASWYFYGIRAFYYDVTERSYLYLVISAIAIVVAHDAYFYWTHRLVHHPLLFRYLHAAHHKSRAPTPWAAYSFDPVDALIIGSFAPLFTYFVPIHWGVYTFFVAHMLVRNVLGHCGYELMPSSTLDTPWLSWNLSVTHHDLHHSSARYNYGLYFSWWDRIMGTEHPQYAAVFAAVVNHRPGDGLRDGQRKLRDSAAQLE